MKIEFDVPKFEKELEISIVIRKDGEVVCKATPPDSGTITKKEEVVSKQPSGKKSTGNLMDSDIF